MGLFDRIAFITRSKANALLDDLEDPVQAINQTIEDATKEYAQVKAAAAQVIAGETQAKNILAEYQEKLAAYNKAAENAVLAGDDASATIALEKATEYETLVNTWKIKVANATKDADAMRNKLNDMARDINEMKAKASEIKADLANAEASKAVAKVQKVSGESAFSRFDKLAEKAERERAEAEAMASLDQPIPDAGEDVLNKYANGGSGATATAAKLAELKARLGK